MSSKSRWRLVTVKLLHYLPGHITLVSVLCGVLYTRGVAGHLGQALRRGHMGGGPGLRPHARPGRGGAGVAGAVQGVGLLHEHPCHRQDVIVSIRNTFSLLTPLAGKWNCSLLELAQTEHWSVSSVVLRQ